MMFKMGLLYSSPLQIKKNSSVTQLIDLREFKINLQKSKKEQNLMGDLKKVTRLPKTKKKKARGRGMSAGECSKEFNIFLPKKIKVIYLPKSWNKFYLKVLL